ncbi:acyl transferase/acyl hydrolase/lysophospholipase [Delphinella strobiligena]|nr:acyl transferase/acyl hydrolase/lysophospholipase [Delphinella strobiligena]
MAGHESCGLRVLALEGGGVRGLSELLILGQLMPLVKDERDPPDDTLDRPCKVFDVICGTSTGGLIAILLGCLKLTVKQAIEEYESLAEEVFGNPKFKVPGREAKYSVKTFERVIRRLIAKYSGDEDVAMLQDTGECKVFVCTQRALAVGAGHPFLMRSYADSTNIDGLTIWQAARATSAAPTFFKRLKIGNREYIDGGIWIEQSLQGFSQRDWKNVQE